MAFLTINGTSYDVQTAGAVRLADLIQGQKRRTFNHSLRSTEHNPKRAWRFTLAPMNFAADNTLRGAVNLGVVVPVGGDAIMGPGVGGTVSCMVTVTDVPFIDDGGVAYLTTPTVDIEEV